METYIEYINRCLPDKPGDRYMYKYKKKILDEMTLRQNEIASRGLKDRRVIDDLIISEYPDLEKGYKEFYEKETKAQRTKRKIIANAAGSALYLAAVIITFLGVSFATGKWNMTWAIVADGVLLWVVYLLSLGTGFFASMKKIFHIFARVFLAGAVIVSGVAAFLFVIAVTDIPKSWLIIMFALIALFVCDGLFCTLHKHRLSLLYWILYIPVISVFVFIIIGALGILAWGIAWIIIPLSLIVDVIIILAAISKNRLDRPEVDDTWKEN